MSFTEGQIAQLRACARAMQDAACLFGDQVYGDTLPWQLKQLAVRIHQAFPQQTSDGDASFVSAFSKHYDAAQLFPAGVLAGGNHVATDVSRLAVGADETQLEALAGNIERLQKAIDDMRRRRAHEPDNGDDDLYKSSANLH